MQTGGPLVPSVSRQIAQLDSSLLCELMAPPTGGNEEDDEEDDDKDDDDDDEEEEEAF